MSRRILEYDVVSSHSVDDLLSAVRASILGGWEPIGGVAALASPNSPTGYVFYQALVKRTRNSGD